MSDEDALQKAANRLAESIARSNITFYKLTTEDFKWDFVINITGKRGFDDGPFDGDFWWVLCPLNGYGHDKCRAWGYTLVQAMDRLSADHESFNYLNYCDEHNIEVDDKILEPLFKEAHEWGKPSQSS